jgi:hypothetical protein
LTLKTKVAYSSELLVSIYKTSRYNSPKNHYLNYGLLSKGITRPLQTFGARPGRTYEDEKYLSKFGY